MMRTVRLFVGDAPFAPESVDQPNALVRSWLKCNDDARRHVEFTTDVANADAVALTREWATYLADPRLDEVARLAAFGLPLLVFAHSDLEPKVPFANAALFHPGPTRAVARDCLCALAVPAFVDDDIASTAPEPFALMPRRAKPLVGFVGHARRKEFGDPVRPMLGAIRNRSKFDRSEKATRFVMTMATSKLAYRARILGAVDKSPLVDTAFIARSSSGSAERPPDYAETQMRDFVENMRSSDYALCMRGTGNYSYRISESLCMGRVPAYVESDAALPFDFTVDWSRHLVVASERAPRDIAPAIRRHYDETDEAARADLQQRNRALWEDRLTEQGFIRHFPEMLDEVARCASA